MGYQSVTVDDGNVPAALRGLLGRLLQSGFVKALLVPKMMPSRDGFVQSLICDPAMLGDANPGAPTMAVQSARIVSELTAQELPGRIGAVLKPCELRAVVELSKFLQVKLDNVVTIGIDCLGTYEVRDFAELLRSEEDASRHALLESVLTGEPRHPDRYPLRLSCQICETPEPPNPDLHLGLIGCDLTREVCLLVGERFPKELAESLGLTLREGAPPGRAAAVSAIASRRKEQRAAALAEVKRSAQGLDKLMQLLSTCIRCHNCMHACPICYCKECVFESPVFEHGPEQFLSWAARKGALRVPADTLLFHLTRMSHMATSCTSCGMCTAACPSRLPVAHLFSLIGSELQGMFGYVAGRALDERPPVSVFKEEEFAAETGSG